MKPIAILATRSMKPYAAQVAAELTKYPSFATLEDPLDGTDLLEVKSFANGEMEVILRESIRGKTTFLFASCARNAAGIGFAEAKLELYHAVDAIKRAQAGKIVLFEPFISCSRSDRTVTRSSVGLWMHFKILMSLGVSQIVTYQLHSDKSKSMLDPTICYIDDIPMMTLLKRYLCDVSIRDVETLEQHIRPHWVFCAVDAGGEKLAQGYANSFGAPLIVAHKQRDYARPNRVESVRILSEEPVKGKTVWIVDDMVDTGGSVKSLIEKLVTLEPAEINLIVVHAVFSPPAAETLNDLAWRGMLHRVVVTDTVSCPEGIQVPGGPLWVEVVSSAELSALIIRSLMNQTPLGALMDSFDAERYLRSPNLFSGGW